MIFMPTLYYLCVYLCVQNATQRIEIKLCMRTKVKSFTTKGSNIQKQCTSVCVCLCVEDVWAKLLVM